MLDFIYQIQRGNDTLCLCSFIYSAPLGRRFIDSFFPGVLPLANKFFPFRGTDFSPSITSGDVITKIKTIAEKHISFIFYPSCVLPHLVFLVTEIVKQPLATDKYIIEGKPDDDMGSEPSDKETGNA